MKIDRISYSESQEFANTANGLKMWRKLGMEAQVDAGEDPQDVVMDLKARVSHILKESSQNGNNMSQEEHTYPAAQPILPSEQLGVREFTSDDEIINQIWECATIEQVAQWKYFANRSNETKQAYLNKLKQFV